MPGEVTLGIDDGVALRAPAAKPSPAPLLGQHYEKIFGAMGLSQAEIADLRAGNVIGEIPGGPGGSGVDTVSNIG